MKFSKMHSAGFLANLMARKFAASLQQEIRDLGLAPAQFMVLAEMSEQDGLTQRQLVERLEVEQATMANTLARMQRDSLIDRLASETDRRAKCIFVTEKGREVLEIAFHRAQKVNATATSDLTPQEREVFVKLMNKVIETLKRR